MICFTNDDKLGGDPQLMNKFKSLIDLTKRMAMTEYYDGQFKDFKEEFKKITGQDLILPGDVDEIVKVEIGG